MGNKKSNAEELDIEKQEQLDQKENDNKSKSTEQELSLEDQLAEAKDKYLRLFAEFDNYKKRTIKEKLDLMKNAATETISALLPVVDDFDRAKKSADESNGEVPFSEGVTLVYQKLKHVLESKGLKAMESTGLPFDSEMHEAITEIPAPKEDMKGQVIDTVEKGYLLNDKIIRYAKVVVGK